MYANSLAKKRERSMTRAHLKYIFISYFMGQQNDTFFPHHSSLLIAHVMDFIIDDPGHFSHDFRSAIKHTSQNLGGHDQTSRGWVDGDVSRH
jgi:hypothetical protein